METDRDRFAQQKHETQKAGTLRNFLLVTIFIILVNLMTFEQALVPTNVDPIMAHFNTRPDILGAIVAGYTIVVAITTLIFGYLSDKIERINLIVLGSVIWALFAIFSFYAQNITQFAIARIFAGLGFGALMPVCFSLLCDIVPPRSRSKAFAVWGISTFIGAIAGALIGADLYAQFEQTGF
ncbi:MAG TPA: MFS transporter, partial [Candidatus Deferrimicrobium sp.]|nr:MFS transporter [Candidatus Deferrimicrobium sp.]